MIPRHRHLEGVIAALKRAPVVCLIGARQVGKTTLAREVAAQSSPARFFDLETPAHLAQLADPMLALEPLRGLVILDEIQRVPDLFTVLRVLTDRPRRPASFLVLGSASPDLLRQSSESLAGRIHYHEVDGFDLTETGAGSWRDLWIRGGFPRSFLAPADEESREWRRDFVRTFLERDIPQLGFSTDATTLRRLSSINFLPGSRISANVRSRRPRCIYAIRASFIRCWASTTIPIFSATRKSALRGRASPCNRLHPFSSCGGKNGFSGRRTAARSSIFSWCADANDGAWSSN